MTQDEDHLRLLSVFHYVMGGLAGLFALLPIFHLVIGVLFVLAPEKLVGKGEPPPALIGWFFIILAGLLIVLGLIFAAFVIIAGHFLARRKHHTFCLVMAGIECLCVPFGTVLGVFTIVVLMRESVKQLFGASRSPAATVGAPVS